jgi:hypothetical protein
VIAPAVPSRNQPDPLLINVPLTLSRAFYPLGFHLELTTNSEDVVSAASDCWGMVPAAFDCAAIRLRVIVQQEGVLAPEPSFRAQGSLFAVIADRQNFATFDASMLAGFCYVSQATAANHEWFRWNFLESIVYTLLSQRYVVPVHAALVELDGRGVLLCGRSGVGKSTLAFACARAGWTYICDDATFLLPGTDIEGIGKSQKVRFREDAPCWFPELSGYPAQPRPNGRFAIESLTANFPGLRTALRARIHHVVLLDREAGLKPHSVRISGRHAVESLLTDMPLFNAPVNEFHVSTVNRLLDVPAWRIVYRNPSEGVTLLNDLLQR